LPAIAVSQQSIHRELGYPRTREYEYSTMKIFLRNLVAHLLGQLPKLPDGIVLSVNVPGCSVEEIAGVEVGHLGRRIYRDKLELRSDVDGRRHYTIYGDDPSHHEEEGTDIAAIHRSCIAVTPLRYHLADAMSAANIAEWPFTNFLQGDVE
jgi:5'/3'-nucleotidase SurE